MAKFKSARSRETAIGSVNRLLETYLPSASTMLPSGGKDGDLIDAWAEEDKSGAAKIAQIKRDAGKINRSEQEKRHIAKKLRKKRGKVIKKRQAVERRVEQLGRLEAGVQADVDELVEKNLRNLESWRPENEEDIREAQAKILSMNDTGGQKGRRRRAKSAKQQRRDDLDEKIKRGHVSAPGLTPGLAPVGESDEDESSGEEGEGLPANFKDDFDEYN